MRIFILCLITCTMVAIFSGCSSYDCAEAPGLSIATISLTPAERDTIILRKFVKGSGFTKLEDSVLIKTENFQDFNDTSAAFAYSGDELLHSGYDYQIYLPSIKKLVTITDMYEPQRKMKTWFLSPNKVGCGNHIQSYAQDGSTVSNTIEFYNRVYIHR